MLAPRIVLMHVGWPFRVILRCPCAHAERPLGRRPHSTAFPALPGGHRHAHDASRHAAGDPACARRTAHVGDPGRAPDRVAACGLCPGRRAGIAVDRPDRSHPRGDAGDDDRGDCRGRARRRGRCVDTLCGGDRVRIRRGHYATRNADAGARMAAETHCVRHHRLFSGMLLGAMFPAVFTIAYVLPAVGGSWRLNVVVWAVPALLMAPVFYLFSPKTRDSRDVRPLRKGLWWPDWRNPLVWLLGFTFAANNSPYFVTSAFLGDYLVALGKPELLGAALGWLNGSQIVALAVLFLTANRLQLRAWPFLVFGPTLLAAFLVLLIFTSSSFAIIAAHGGDRHRRRGHDDRDPGAAAATEPAGRRAAHRRRHVHRQLHLRDHHSDHLRRALGLDWHAVDGLRAALRLRGGADGARRHRRPGFDRRRNYPADKVSAGLARLSRLYLAFTWRRRFACAGGLAPPPRV